MAPPSPIATSWVPVQITERSEFVVPVVCAVQFMPGIVEGETEAEGADGALVPKALEAVTVKEYVAPLVKPVITQNVAEEALHCLLVSSTDFAV